MKRHLKQPSRLLMLLMMLMKEASFI